MAPAIYGDDIKSAGGVCSMGQQIIAGSRDEPLLFARSYALQRSAEALRGPLAYFDKHDFASMLHDKVNFSLPGVKVAPEAAQAVAAEKFERGRFGLLAQCT